MSGFLTISIDFELFWGVRDVCSIEGYGPRILGYRQAVPAMLNLFREFDVAATWAVVGCAACTNKKELLAFAPTLRPGYLDEDLDPYAYLERVGSDESTDPYHFGGSLVRQIVATPRMERGSHTFSHFYCLEERREAGAFRADLASSRAILRRFDCQPASLVFPRNQYDEWHLGEAAAEGFTVFRGNEDHVLFRPRGREGQSAWIRVGRLADSYLNLTGDHPADPRRDASTLINVPSSRLLRAFNARLSLLEPMRLARIAEELERAAKRGGGYHLWWHPHNFGNDLAENLNFLRRVLERFRRLREETGMRSLTMAEAAGEGGGPRSQP